MDLTKLIPDGLKRAIAAKIARGIAFLAAGAAFGFLSSHTEIAGWINQACASLSSEDAMKGFFGTVALALLAGFWSVKDAKGVFGKMATAAAVGFDKGQATALQQAMQQGAEVQASADTTKIAAVADAMKEADKASKQDKATLVAAIKSGSF